MEDKKQKQAEMMMQSLEMMAQSMDTANSLDEITQLVSGLIKFTQDNGRELSTGFKNLRLMFVQAQEDLENSNNSSLNLVKLKLLEEIRLEIKKAKGEKGDNYILTENDKKEIASKIEVPVVEKVIETVIKEHKKEETSEETANRLNTKEEIIEQETIVGLVKRLKKIEDDLKKKSTTTIIGGATGGGHIAKIHDLSNSLDGVTKTFSLPAFWRVLSVYSTSSPVIFRPIIDYTTDASAMTITFTSEINAQSTLSSGQTLLILYSE